MAHPKWYTLILTMYQYTKRTADGQTKLSRLIIDLRRIIPTSNHNHITVNGTSEKTRIDFFFMEYTIQT